MKIVGPETVLTHTKVFKCSRVHFSKVEGSVCLKCADLVGVCGRCHIYCFIFLDGRSVTFRKFKAYRTCQDSRVHQSPGMWKTCENFLEVYNAVDRAEDQSQPLWSTFLSLYSVLH